MIRSGWGTGQAAEGRWAADATASVAGTGAADRFCAWAGRSGRRVIFTVVASGPDGDVVGLSGILLGVKREAGGRRVLWRTVLSGHGLTGAQRHAIARLRQEGCGELHLHNVVGDAASCEGIAADLDLPRLEAEEPLRLAS